MLCDAITRYYDSIDSATNIFKRYYQNRFLSDDKHMKQVVSNLINLSNNNEGGLGVDGINNKIFFLYGGIISDELAPSEAIIYINAYCNNLLKRL